MNDTAHFHADSDVTTPTADLSAPTVHLLLVILAAAFGVQSVVRALRTPKDQ